MDWSSDDLYLYEAKPIRALEEGDGEVPEESLENSAIWGHCVSAEDLSGSTGVVQDGKAARIASRVRFSFSKVGTHTATA